MTDAAKDLAQHRPMTIEGMTDALNRALALDLARTRRWSKRYLLRQRIRGLLRRKRPDGFRATGNIVAGDTVALDLQAQTATPIHHNCRCTSDPVEAVRALERDRIRADFDQHAIPILRQTILYAPTGVTRALVGQLRRIGRTMDALRDPWAPEDWVEPGYEPTTVTYTIDPLERTPMRDHIRVGAIIAALLAIAVTAFVLSPASASPSKTTAHHVNRADVPGPQPAPFYVPPSQLQDWVGPLRVYLHLPYDAKEWQRQLRRGHLQRQDMVAILAAHDRPIGLFRADYLRAFLVLREVTR